jgi:hypothetical protein
MIINLAVLKTPLRKFLLALSMALVSGAGTSLYVAWPHLMREQDAPLIRGPCICNYVKLRSCVYLEYSPQFNSKPIRPEELYDVSCESVEMRREYIKSAQSGFGVAIFVFSLMTFITRFKLPSRNEPEKEGKL